MVDDLLPGMAGPVAAAMSVLMTRIPPEPAAELGRLAAPSDAGLRLTNDYRRRALVRSAPSDARLRLIDNHAREALGRMLMPEVPIEMAMRVLQRTRDHIATARAATRDAPSEPPALDALRMLAPTTADRLLGALELTVPALDLSAAPDVRPHLHLPRAGELTFDNTPWDSEVGAAAGLLDRFRPGFVEPIAELTAKLADQPAIAALLTVSADLTDERAIAAAHGAAHIALGVVTAAAVLRAVQVPRLVGRIAAVVGIGVGSAMLVLRAAPLPPAYMDAVLAKVREEEDPLPRGSSDSVSVVDHWFALVEGDLPSEVDFTANGLVTAVPGGAAIRTGRATGTVGLMLRVLANEPVVDGAGWDEIVEVSWHATEGRVSVVGPGDRELLGATVPRPGGYRMRVHASGRDDPDDDEHYELVVWPAEATPATVHKATDLLGHRLRGEPEPPQPDRPERAYRWVSSSMLGDAATVTVVTGSTLADVVRAFGGDPDGPRSLRELGEEQMRTTSLDPYIAVLADGDAVFVVEFNGFQGSLKPPLARASAGGRAASMYWNVNGLTRLSFAERGRVLASFEPLVGNLDIEPPIAEAIAGIDFADYRDKTEKGLVAVERFTGHGITAEQLDRIIATDVAFETSEN